MFYRCLKVGHSCLVVYVDVYSECTFPKVIDLFDFSASKCSTIGLMLEQCYIHVFDLKVKILHNNKQIKCLLPKV